MAGMGGAVMTHPSDDELEAAEMSAKHWHARAKAAEAELDEAVGLMQDMRDHGANDYVIDRVLAFLARHQKEAGV